MSERDANLGSEHPASSGGPLSLDDMLELARKVTEAADAPVVGGLAVALHGWQRYTRDIDIYSDDFKATHEKLLRAGMPWNARKREHLIGGVPIHMVPNESLGGPPKRISTIKGVKVISLADLIRGKLTVGLVAIDRAKDLADVVELIRVLRLKKDFAAKLPTALRAPFKEIVEQVHGPRRTTITPKQFWTKHA
jgi:hypothetical protein